MQQTHRLRECIYGCWGKKEGEEIVKKFGIGHVHTAMFKMDNQQGPTVQPREHCSLLCGNPDGRGVLRIMNTRLSLFCLCPRN